MSECLSDTLAELVDRFLIRINVEKKKHFSRYLILAEECWQDVFQNTLWVIKSVWMPTKSGTPYNYVNMPPDCQRLLSVGNEDKCGLIQPLYYNNQINVVKKPTVKKCACAADCDCSGLCEAVNSTTVTSKLIFTINGVQYFEKKWIKYCPNGDVLEFTETPTKKYNSLSGDSGDFNSDFNNDYLIASAPFSDYTIVTVTTQKKICKLEVLECGCPVETQENETMFFDCCGYYVNWSSCCKRKKCHQFSPNINNNHFGNVKLSECGNKIYYIPSHSWRKVLSTETPDYLLVNYQSTGTSPGAETLVPLYARPLMYAMMDSARKEYNSAFSQNDKDAASYKKIDEKNKIMGYLSPWSLSEMSDVQDAPIKW